MSAAAVAIRPETIEDVPATAALHVAAWQRGYAGILPDDYLRGLDVDEWAGLRRARLVAPREGARNRVAEIDGQVAGFVVYGPDTEVDTWDEDEAAAGRIWACYVHPDHWGQGVGGALVRHALRDLTEPVVHVWLLEANARARRLYERHGFEADGRRDDYVPRGTDLHAVEIRLTVDRGHENL
jgi:ribosomal protein S18 acetylase RimI-like enzyme